jgi:hypothetical protein
MDSGMLMNHILRKYQYAENSRQVVEVVAVQSMVRVPPEYPSTLAEVPWSMAMVFFI